MPISFCIMESFVIKFNPTILDIWNSYVICIHTICIKRKLELKLIIEYLTLGINGKGKSRVEGPWSKTTRGRISHAIVLSARSRNKARRGNREMWLRPAYRGGMRGAIIAICINDPRTHGARRMIAAGCSPGRLSQSANSSPGYVRIVLTRPGIIALPSRFWLPTLIRQWQNDAWHGRELSQYAFPVGGLPFRAPLELSDRSIYAARSFDLVPGSGSTPGFSSHASPRFST